MKPYRISTIDTAFLKETFTLAYSLEPYQLINALTGVAASFAEQLDPDGKDENHFCNAVVIVRQGIEATMDAPDSYPILFAGFTERSQK